MRRTSCSFAAGVFNDFEITNDESMKAKTLWLAPTKTRLEIIIIFKGKENGEESIISLEGNGPLFTINSPVTLVLTGGITLQGHSENSSPLIKVASGGTLVMHAGAKIKDNKTDSDGGGVFVDKGGSFIMDGGEISGNTARNGGGVYCNGSFLMTGGMISGNTAHNGDAVYVGKDGNFTKAAGPGLRLDSGISGAFKNLPEKIEAPELYFEAMKSNAIKLKNVPKKYRTAELCFAAVKKNIRALEYVSEEHKTEEMRIKAEKTIKPEGRDAITFSSSGI